MKYGLIQYVSTMILDVYFNLMLFGLIDSKGKHFKVRKRIVARCQKVRQVKQQTNI